MMRPLAIVFMIGVPIVGCSIGETNYETMTLPIKEKKEVKACDSPFVLPNLAELPSCGDGKGHCFPADKTTFLAANLEPCPNGDSCLPDKYLSMNGQKAKSCTFYINGKPGACVSMLVKDIKANKDALHQEDCDPDERCAPCEHPIEHYDTKLCGEIGAHEKPCGSNAAGGTKAETCCHGMGVCMTEDAAPADSREDLPHDACPNQKLCAPAALIDGKPTKCEGVLGMDGVCVDLCFAGMLRGTTPVTRSSCQATELCLPCLIGKGQGMPGCD